MIKKDKIMLWTPRILSILFILFLAMFSLDVFSEDYTFLETLLALFMHNIPVFILIIILAISWKYEIVGGVAFILTGLFYMWMVIFNANFDSDWIAIVIISGPAFFIGILFVVNWFKNKSKKKK